MNKTLKQYRKPIKIAIFLLALLPWVLMWIAAVQESLGPDPAKVLSHISGEWALRFLVLTLAITPIRLISQSAEWIHYRRMLGLFAFFYAVNHLIIYCLFLLALQWQELWADIVERPFITVGFLALLILLPLAITSTKNWQRKLGRNWARLHKLIYIAVALVLLHFIWQARSDLTEPLVYTAVVIVLMLFRLPKVKMLLSRRAA